MRTSITERRTSSNESRVPPTEPAKSVSPVKQASLLTTNERPPGLWPGVRSVSTRSSPVSTTSPWASGSAPATPSDGSARIVAPNRRSISPWLATWSPCPCVVRRCVIWRLRRSTASTSGSSGAPLSTKTPVPPARSATRYALESHEESMLRWTITPAVGCQRPNQGRNQMGLMSRTSNVIKAWWSKLLNRAEDPSVTLDYSYERQREMLQKVKKGIADVVTAKKRLQLQSQKLEVEMPKLDEQARQALAAGREDVARAAIERKA